MSDTITTRVEAEAYWPAALRAIQCHASQVGGLPLQQLPEEMHRTLWGRSALYRAYSTANGGRAIETDLFAGLR